MKISKITRRRLKKHSIIVRVNKNLSLRLTIAPYVTKKDIENFLSKNKENINKLIENQRQRNQETENLKNSHSEEILLFGKWHKINFYNTTGISIKENNIFLSETIKEYTKSTLIKTVYKSLAEKIFPVLVSEEETKTGIKSDSLKISHAKSRWGSFNSKGRMSLSYFLMACPAEVIRYVICHELCHKKVMNHQKDFYKILDTYYPNRQEYDKTLKETGKYLRSIDEN